jgi:capsular exopolysaccharide synthesis family protein
MLLNDLAVVYANEAAVSKTINSRPLDNLRRRQESLNQMMAQTRQQLKPNIKNQLLTDPYGEGQQRIQELEESKAYFQAMNAEFDEQIAELNNQLKLSLQQNLGLQEQKAQIERTQRMVDGMATRLQALEVEQDAPERIQKLEDAVSIPGYNTMQRIIMVTMAAMFGLALSCFGVALLDFRHRKLNSPTQMDQGLGIRVLGVLPRLAIRKSASADSVLAVLTESIDNVRTSLMHSSTSSKTQIVMITSAGEHEGRTTVASQLAASLARAGRRTLLVDGDLRHPSLDRLFDVPLADGLCELLRAEVDVADAVRPTNAEGLWLLTAGFCDVAAVQALAREQAQPIFDKLREEFDFVIIDSAPVLNMSDSLIMGQYTDGAVLSVVRDYSRAPKIYEASDRLKRVGVRVLGCVVNGVSAKPSHRVERLWIESAESAASNS